MHVVADHAPATLGLGPRTRAGAEFAAFLRSDTQLWSGVIREAGIEGNP